MELEGDPDASSARPSVCAVFATVEADPELLAEIGDASVLAQVKMLSGAGYWYYALDKLSQKIATGDKSQPWRELRADLLEQVGLDAAAGFDPADVLNDRARRLCLRSP